MNSLSAYLADNGLDQEMLEFIEGFVADKVQFLSLKSHFLIRTHCLLPFSFFSFFFARMQEYNEYLNILSTMKKVVDS